MPMPMTELLRVAQQGDAFAHWQRQQLESAGGVGAESLTLRIDQDGRLWPSRCVYMPSDVVIGMEVMSDAQP
jgi:hypothetical protein